ncbi:MAG: HAMP domain-containing sensor histidine kinase [Candidatus Saccharibacteria bacterium]
MKTNFVKSIKFRLAMVFTVILFVFSGTIILLFNVAIDNYLSTRQTPAPVIQQTQPPTLTPKDEPINDNRSRYANQLEDIKKYSIYGLFVLAVISLALGYYISGRFLKPLNELNDQIFQLKSNSLGAQIKYPPDNEFGETMKYFNEMSLRLQKAFDQQARFVQDASHELRTPLTILRTNIETVLDDKNASKTDLRNSMNDALTEIDLATTLANDLLTLSRPQSKIRDPENMSEIVSESVAMMKKIALNSNVSIKLIITDKNIPVIINKSEMIRAINNIISNAIKYSAGVKSAHVGIVVKHLDNNVLIVVKDNGIGIPKSDINRIFDRFYRVDKSRDRKTGGFGLGLPITKKIITDHQGKISVTSKPGQTEFTVIIPIHK